MDNSKMYSQRTISASRAGRTLLPQRLIWVIVIILLSKYTNGEQRFLQEPSETTVRHGQEVLLPCVVADKKGDLQWTKDGFGLGTSRLLEGFERYQMVGTDETGNYSLYISSAHVSDDAEYQCQVGGAAGEKHLRSNVARLTVHVPPIDDEDNTYVDKPSPVHTTESKMVRLNCITGLAKPAPEVKWLDGKGSEITQGVNQTLQSHPNSALVSVRSWLNLSPTKEHHQTNITCKISHVALEEPILRSVLLLVKYKPKVTISVDSVKIREGDDVLFKCEAQGNPSTLTYSWRVNDVGEVGAFESSMQLRNIGRDKNGATITCLVSNAVGTGKADYTLSVEYPPQFKVEPKDLSEDEGNEVTLVCDLDGNPPPEIIWTHEDSKKVIKLGAELVLKVSSETEGEYHCRAAVTEFKEVSRSIRVFMKGPPRVDPEEVQYGLEGDSVQVDCLIRSMPRPVEVEWKRYGQSINLDDSRFRVIQEDTRDGVRNTLLITESQREDFGEYNCTAKNGYGSNVGTIQLNRQLCQVDKEMAIKIAFRESLPLVTTLVAIIGGIVFLVVVIVIIVLCKKRGKPYKDSGLEKHSMRSSDRSSTHDSVLKVETRTGSDLSPDEDEDYSQDEWETSDTNATRDTHGPHPHDPFRYSGGFADPVFPPKDGANNSGGGYVQYVDYSRDYNPPPIAYNRNSLYAGGTPLNNLDPRYSAAYGNPYLRVPSNARSAHNVYSGGGGTTGGGGGGGGSGGGGGGGLQVRDANMNATQPVYSGQTPTPGAGQTGGTTPIRHHPPNNLNAGVNNNTVNNNNNNNINASVGALYGQVGQPRGSMRTSASNQYIMVPQAEVRLGVHGTHI